MTGLKGWWPLHDNSGSTARDLSGNGNQGTLNGGVTLGVAGKGGLTAYSFDGSTGFVDVPNLGPNKFTVSAWVRTKDASNSQTVACQRPESGGARRWDLNVNNGKFRIVSYTGTTGYGTELAGNINSNRWHMVTGSYDGSTWHAYVDGQKVDSSTESIPSDNGNNSSIGARVKTGGSFISGVNGKVAGVRFYDRVLSAFEIQTLYEWGNGDYTRRSLHDGSDSGAVSRWKFDGAVTDSWGSNDGNDNTSVGYSNNSIRGDAKKFDSSNNNYISISDSSSLNITEEITLAGWINPGIEDARSIATKDGAYHLQTRSGTDDNKLSVQMGIYSGGSLDGWSRSSEISPLNKWTHVAGTFDGSTIRTYVNGVMGDETGYGSGIGTSSSDLRIGDDTGSSNYWYDGLVDDVRIYKRALSPSEVFQLYQWGTCGRDMRKLTTNARGDQ